MDKSTRPWLTGNEAPYATLYGLSRGKHNANAVYAPGVDRFILTENFNFLLTIEVAQILSSKLPTQVFILGNSVRDFNNSNCLEYTIVDKRKYNITGSNILVARQTPVLNTAIEANSIDRIGIPKDYSKGTARDMLFKLQEYSLFVLRCLHAIECADAFLNYFPLKHILTGCMPGKIPLDLKVPDDHSTAPNGMKNTIKEILYQSLTIEECLEKIESAWYNYAAHIPYFRNLFYHYMNLEIPERLKNQIPDNNFFSSRVI